ncbi:Retrovirus-related Pol polyprotein from transposon 412 [Frankliniella fusca]|uniref:Retrovirus-related Pol polyprotein from transposon 412 n=1 Tax=Frankliniella fusca TaxID=407009 RepID=A0AAE1HNI9_9NEOP|nr:Retrovirus-related Pol polyprotein from transposon 412 [Frankliniella fusca]
MVYFLVDLGASLTVLKRGLLPDPAPLSSTLAMRNADKTLPLSGLYGPRRVVITFQSVSVPVMVYEGDVHDDCLLGGDFIAAYVQSVDIDGDSMILRDGGVRIPLARVTTPSSAPAAVCARVEVFAGTVVPPRSSLPVPVRVRGCEVLGCRRVGPTLPDSDGLATHAGREGRGRCTIPPEPSAACDLPYLQRQEEEDTTVLCGVEVEIAPVALCKGTYVSPQLLADDGELCLMVHNYTDQPARLPACVARMVISGTSAVNTTAACTPPATPAAPGTPGAPAAPAAPAMPQPLLDLAARTCVPLVMLSLRVAPHATTGVSPAMLMFGRDLSLPSVLARGPLPDQAAPRLPRAEYPAWLQARLRDLHHTVRERADVASWRMKERYDLRARRPHFAVGDAVWFFNPRRHIGRAAKLQSWWMGPFKIMDRLSEVTFRIRDESKPRKKPRVVHADRLAPVVPRVTATCR